MIRAYTFSSRRAVSSGCLALLVALTLVWGLVAAAQEEPAATAAANTEARASGETPQSAGNGVVNPPKPTPGSALQLGPGDLVEISVYNVPELNTKARVSSGGDLYLPLIDYVHVGGLTIDEAQRVIEKRLADGGFVKDPHVTVFVDEYASQGASLLGEVTRPGVYPVLGQQRLFDLLSLAGGLTDKAGDKVTITHRDQSSKPLTLPLARNVTEDPDSNVRILPGDTVVVRRADIVYVVGDVQHPTGILMSGGSLTVMQAIALAGGTTKTSKLNGVKIIRHSPSGMTEMKVQLKKILEAKVADEPMRPDDILFVPSSAFRGAMHSDISTALQVSSLGLVIAR